MNKLSMYRSSGRLRLPAVCAVVLVAALFGCQQREAPSEMDEPAVTEGQTLVADPVDSGEIVFALYCVSCHGESGRGDGPVADALTTPPTDLTMLSVKYGGVFPAEEIYAYVDGRRFVQAHGTREMPVWGNIWTDSVGGGETDAEVDIRIRELVAYIRSIQESP